VDASASDRVYTTVGFVKEVLASANRRMDFCFWHQADIADGEPHVGF